MSVLFWWFDAVVTPLTIPNREVKRRCSDGTRKGRVAIRQNKVLKSNLFSIIKKLFGAILILVIIIAGAFLWNLKNFSKATRVTEGAGDCVVLIHGLGRSLESMSGLEAAFKKRGYQTVNIGYPSTSFGVADLADKFIGPGIKEGCSVEGKKINFVTHSLGGLMVRYYLAHNQLPNLGRVVMITPPNHGSEIADYLKRSKFMQWLVGPVISELGVDPASLPSTLPEPNYEVGIIAGKSFNPFFSPFIPGEDDGTVAIESAKLRQMKDFVVVHSQHSLITGSEEAIAKALNFIEQGEF